jgi:hypothetical protein
MSDFMCYVAKEKCDCMTGVCVDEPQLAKYTAKDVADWIRDGRRVERVDGDIVKASFAKCPKYVGKRYEAKICKDCEWNQ